MILWYIPSDVNYERNITTFYNEQSSLVQLIRKHKILVIGEDINVHIDKTESYTFCLNNRSTENILQSILWRAGLYARLISEEEGRSTNEELHNIYITKKWVNSTMNCKAYSSFAGLSSDHFIDSAMIHSDQSRNASLTWTGMIWRVLTCQSWYKQSQLVDRRK